MLCAAFPDGRKPDLALFLQPEIPHVEEHVSKVECVGLQTQSKLQDIRAAAAAVGIHNLAVVHNCITSGARVHSIIP